MGSSFSLVSRFAPAHKWHMANFQMSQSAGPVGVINCERMSWKPIKLWGKKKVQASDVCGSVRKNLNEGYIGDKGVGVFFLFGPFNHVNRHSLFGLRVVEPMRLSCHDFAMWRILGEYHPQRTQSVSESNELLVLPYLRTSKSGTNKTLQATRESEIERH